MYVEGETTKYYEVYKHRIANRIELNKALLLTAYKSYVEKTKISAKFIITKSQIETSRTRPFRLKAYKSYVEGETTKYYEVYKHRIANRNELNKALLLKAYKSYVEKTKISAKFIITKSQIETSRTRPFRLKAYKSYVEGETTKYYEVYTTKSQIETSRTRPFRLKAYKSYVEKTKISAKFIITKSQIETSRTRPFRLKAYKCTSKEKQRSIMKFTNTESQIESSSTRHYS